MKRTQEKIKDFVAAQAFDEVQNYASDLPRALAAYRFTDATSDLLARWLDALADLPRSRGAARALAGLRGVGKSHTLTAFGALAAFPHLRSTVEDAHVATSARRLLNRRYTVARVERGTRATLVEEIRAALAEAFGGDESEWNHEPGAMLAIAASKCETPLVVSIDTAFDREARVRRDDGPLLSELARATTQVNVFIALALDDDIAGADGANVSLAGTFQIDYLDPEHLYRVADLHLFQKSPQSRAALHEMYVTLRAAVPGFNWSEPRFAAIYPVHPLVADVSPAVRLYSSTFAFLPFAATAGARAANRPALSLVVLDDVFDRTEYDLRKSEDLKEAFRAYDELATKAIAQIPIMQRLQAKLVLKGLFILSLDGRGATARELGAAMLLYDEKPQAVTAVERIAEMLKLFAAAAPEGHSLSRAEDGGEIRYRFNIRASAGFDAALAERARDVKDESVAIEDLLRNVARARFEDWPFADDNTGAMDPQNFLITWRGTGRQGRLILQATSNETHRTEAQDAEAQSQVEAGTPEAAHYDWEVLVLSPDTASAVVANISQRIRSRAISNGLPLFAVWRPAPLSLEEREALRRLVALRADSTLLAEYGETARAAERTQTALSERIWSRVYLDDGALLFGDLTRNFTDDARASQTLFEMLSSVLAPLLGVRFPQHPVFAGALGETEAARLIAGLFGGANQSDPSLQDLARLFAAPLGLASLRGGLYVLEAGDQALKQPWVREVLAMTDEADGEVVPLEEVYQKLAREPYGLQRETQHLILAALVAQRRIELITNTGDRIGRRTLDLKLRWDEIAGVARAEMLVHTAEELTAWARALTGNLALASIAEPDAREEVRAALNRWLEEWRAIGLLERSDAMPDEGLTTRAWNLTAAVRRSFGAAAEAVESALSDTISLEEGLQRVADSFSDSEEQFARSSLQLKTLTAYVSGLEERERRRAYLATAEPTALPEIENARQELLATADNVHTLFDHDSTARFSELWQEFQARYSEHYAMAHEQSVGVNANTRALEALLRSDAWRELESLAELSIVNKQYLDDTVALLERIKQTRCDLNIRQMLAERPVCVCAFRLSRASELAALTQELEAMMERGRNAYRRTLMHLSTPLAIALDALARSEGDTEMAHRARSLSGAFARGTGPDHFTSQDVRLTEHALERIATPPPVRVRLPAAGLGLLTRDELRARLNQWLDDLPDQPAIIEVVGEGESDAAT